MPSGSSHQITLLAASPQVPLGRQILQSSQGLQVIFSPHHLVLPGSLAPAPSFSTDFLFVPGGWQPGQYGSFAVSSVSGFLVSWPCLRSHPVLSLPASYQSPAWGVSDIHGLGGGSLSVPFSEAPWKPPYSLSLWNGKSRGSSQSFCGGNFWNVYLFSWAFIFFLNIWVALKVPKAFIFLTVMSPWYLEGCWMT